MYYLEYPSHLFPLRQGDHVLSRRVVAVMIADIALTAIAAARSPGLRSLEGVAVAVVPHGNARTLVKAARKEAVVVEVTRVIDD